MTEDQEKLVNSVFDSWNRGETSTKLAIEQLTRIAEATSDNELRRLAIADIETVKLYS